MTHNLIRKLLIIGLCSLFSAAASAQTFIFTAIPDEDETKLVERFRGIAGKRDDVKKAVVTLEEGHSIDVSTGL